MPTSTDTTTTQATDTAALAETILWIDPAQLLDNPDNPRVSMPRVNKMRDSIKLLGVLEPLRITETPDGYLIHAGHCRKYGAIAAEVTAVPCVLVTAEVTRGTVIAGALAENLVREGLTKGEKVAAVQQLVIAEGWSQTAIRKAGGFTADEAKALVTVARSEVAAAVAQRYEGVTLDQAVIIAEFADDPETVKALTVAAEQGATWNFNHLASQKRKDREYEQLKAATTATLTKQGATMYDEVAHPEAVGLWRLNDSDGHPLDVEAHAACPGHVALVDDYKGDEVHYLCADPEVNGHVETTSTPAPSTGSSNGGAMTDEQREERRRVIANNKAALAATEVRYGYLANLLARKTPPAGTLRFVAQVMVSHGSVVSDATDASTAAVLGVDVEHGSWGTNPLMDRLLSESTDKRLPVVALAQVAAGIEAHWDKGFWRRPREVHAAYLAFLVSTGYEASDVEQIVIDAFTDEA